MSHAASSFSWYQLYIIFTPIRFYYAAFPSLPSFPFLNFQFPYIVFIFLIQHGNQFFNNYLYSRLPLFSHLIIQRQVACLGNIWSSFFNGEGIYRGNKRHNLHRLSVYSQKKKNHHHNFYIVSPLPSALPDLIWVLPFFFPPVQDMLSFVLFFFFQRIISSLICHLALRQQALNSCLHFLVI